MTFVRPCDHMEDVKTMCKWYSRNRGHPLVAEHSAATISKGMVLNGKQYCNQ